MKRGLLKDHKGMTLIEVLLSITIIGIIAVTFLPIVTNSFINVLNSGDKIKSMYDSSGKIEEAIASRESIDIDGESFVFRNASIPVKFKNHTLKSISGGKVVKDGIGAFVTDVPTITFDPYFLYEGYTELDKTINVTSADIKFSTNSTYKVNGESFPVTRINDNNLKLILSTSSSNAWKNEKNPYIFEVKTGIRSAKGLIQILQPKLMIVGMGNNVRISSDFNNNFAYWRERNTTSSRGLNSIQYIDSLIGKGYIAVGNEGKILTLYEGAGWNSIGNNLTSKDLMDIAYGNRNLLVVGRNGTILHSNAKDSWKSIDIIDFNEDLNGVDYSKQDGEDYFFAVGKMGSILTWKVGEDWNQVDWNDIDSINKTDIEKENFNDVKSINYKTIDNKLMNMAVAVGTNGTIVSNFRLAEEANKTWFNTDSELTEYSLNAIASNNDIDDPILVTVGEKGTILYSDNKSDNKIGLDWDKINVVGDKINLIDIQFLDGRFLIIGNENDESTFFATSIDGESWNVINTNIGKIQINKISGY